MSSAEATRTGTLIRLNVLDHCWSLARDREREASMFMQIERRVLMLDDRDAFNGRNINFIQRVEVDRAREREKKRELTATTAKRRRSLSFLAISVPLYCVSFAYFYDFFSDRLIQVSDLNLKLPAFAGASALQSSWHAHDLNCCGWAVRARSMIYHKTISSFWRHTRIIPRRKSRVGTKALW